MKLSSTHIVPLIVACALFMENLDASIITTALPAMAQALQAPPLQLNLAITAYVFSIALFIPLSGWLADKYGARRIFCTAVIVFMVGSLLCGLALNLPMLIIARIIQGLGGAMMVPVGRLVLLRTVPKNELVSAMAWVTIPALVGPVVGPLLGGLMVTYADWRWIFFVNLPIGALGLYLGLRFIGDFREIQPPKFDSRGFMLVAVGLCGLIFGLEALSHHFLPWPWIASLILAGVSLLLIYRWHASRHHAPIINLRLFRHATFRLTALGGFLFRIGVGGLPFLLPLLFQLSFGLSALQSGLLTFVSAMGALFMKTLAGRILKAYGFRQTLMINAALSALSIAGVLLFRADTPHLVIALVLLLGGFSRSLQFTSLNTLIYADVADKDMSGATAVASMLQQLSTSVGVSLAALVLNAMVGNSAANQFLPLMAFWPPLLMLALITLASMLLLRQLPATAGAILSGQSVRKLA